MKIITILFLQLLPSLLIAAEQTKTSEWKGEGELGFTSTSGNTDSDSLNAKLGIQKSHEKWTHKAGVQVLKASTDGVDSADSAILTERSEYRFAEKFYSFGAIRYERDKFSGFDYQSSISIGIGDQFIKTTIQELDVSAGLGYRKLKETVTGETSNEAIVTGNLNYQYVISEHATLMEKIVIESGDTNTHTESDTSIKMKVSGNLGSKISYTIKSNSNVPDGVEKYDRITSVTLVYSF